MFGKLGVFVSLNPLSEPKLPKVDEIVMEVPPEVLMEFSLRV